MLSTSRMHAEPELTDARERRLVPELEFRVLRPPPRDPGRYHFAHAISVNAAESGGPRNTSAPHYAGNCRRIGWLRRRDAVAALRNHGGWDNYPVGDDCRSTFCAYG